LVDSLRLAGVTGNSYSLIEMKSRAVAKNLALVEYNLVLENSAKGKIPYSTPALWTVF
jgi:hypothetical protein